MPFIISNVKGTLPWELVLDVNRQLRVVSLPGIQSEIGWYGTGFEGVLKGKGEGLSYSHFCCSTTYGFRSYPMFYKIMNKNGEKNKVGADHS